MILTKFVRLLLAAVSINWLTTQSYLSNIPGASEGLVSCGCDDISVVERAGNHVCRHKA